MLCPHCCRKSGLLPAPAVARRLGMSLKKFDRHYVDYFTDRRPVKCQHKGVTRLIPEDEVNLVVAEGWEAVIDFRRRQGRITPEQAIRLADGFDPANVSGNEQEGALS